MYAYICVSVYMYTQIYVYLCHLPIKNTKYSSVYRSSGHRLCKPTFPADICIFDQFIQNGVNSISDKVHRIVKRPGTK